MELFFYIFISSLIWYFIISIIHKKLVWSLRVGSPVTFEGRQSVLVGLGLIFVFIIGFGIRITVAGLSLNYSILYLSMVIGLPFGWITAIKSASHGQYFKLIILGMVGSEAIFFYWIPKWFNLL